MYNLPNALTFLSSSFYNLPIAVRIAHQSTYANSNFKSILPHTPFFSWQHPPFASYCYYHFFSAFELSNLYFTNLLVYCFIYVLRTMYYYVSLYCVMHCVKNYGTALYMPSSPLCSKNLTPAKQVVRKALCVIKYLISFTSTTPSGL